MNKTDHPLYKTWANMIARCEIPGASRYKNYGALGVSVCDRWRKDFWAFVSDMGNRPKGSSIDRIDPRGNYTPDNCRWASRTEQARNTRSARYVEVNGNLVHVSILSEKTGIAPKTLFWRNQKGWPLEKILDPSPQWNNSESQTKAVRVHAELKRSQTHCKRGHPLSGENLYFHKGRRHCRSCRRAQDRYLYYGKSRPLSDFL